MNSSCGRILSFLTIFVLAFQNASTSTEVGAGCGGGCILSQQCVNWSGPDCRCLWFTCSLITANDPAMKDVEQFEEFIKNYSGNPKMILSAAANVRHEKKIKDTKTYGIFTYYTLN